MTTTEVALVTGANKGIGKEIARGLGQLGITVLASARDETRGAAAVAELAGEGLDARFVRLDVTDERSVAEAAELISADFGRLDILVNNAGITNDLVTPPSETSLGDLRRVYETNVFGVVAVTNAMLPLLRNAPSARIVNVSSGLGSLARHTAPGCTLGLYFAYSTSKTALNAVTVQYARELRDAGIAVNACAPGLCATDLNGHMGDRTPAQGAKIAIELATAEPDGPTAGFFDENGPVSW
ncbi:SDR family oxidoreductase [Gandjariella thermophila]|uniref:Dehydrogenase n=1 Tax=Gandjariella thermophila TaxID=1931992 RepID=A0A4D4JDW7_9PSEU|nr:SDR family oxidoreductase [Gandjariella thermophila]GDY32097.1 dehydrogenase [Gandjariella thermophila]